MDASSMFQMAVTNLIYLPIRLTLQWVAVPLPATVIARTSLTLNPVTIVEFPTPR